MRATERERTLTKAGLEGRLTSSDGRVLIDVIVDDGVLPGCQFLEYEQPVMCENLTVENECAVYHAFYLLSLVISIGELIGK